MKNKKIIIALVANIGAGKSFVSDYIEEKYGAKSIKYSSVLKNILQILNLEEKRSNFANLSLALRKQFGENILENAIISKIENIDSEILLLDGVRRKEDIDNIKKLENFYLIFIDTSLEVRSERMKSRAEKNDDKNINIEVLNKDEQHDSENRVSMLKKEADFIIDNNSTIENLKENINNVIKKIL